MTNDPRTGRTWLRLAKWIIARDNATCWRCGHPGADTAGHILPVSTHPQLARDPNNLRAEHGRRRTLERDGYDCIGNFAAGADAGQRTSSITQRRWLDDTDS